MPTLIEITARKAAPRRAARTPAKRIVAPGKNATNSAGGGILNLSIHPDGTASIKLDALTVGVLVSEAKTCRKPAGELAALLLREALEDARDLRDARRVLARVKSGKEATVPWSQVKAELGL